MAIIRVRTISQSQSLHFGHITVKSLTPSSPIGGSNTSKAGLIPHKQEDVSVLFSAKENPNKIPTSIFSFGKFVQPKPGL